MEHFVESSKSPPRLPRVSEAEAVTSALTLAWPQADSSGSHSSARVPRLRPHSGPLWMLVTRAVAKPSEDSQHLSEKRLGLSQPVGIAEQQGQVVEADPHVGMLRA
jgi:hypothetical protein